MSSSLVKDRTSTNKHLSPWERHDTNSVYLVSGPWQIHFDWEDTFQMGKKYRGSVLLRPDEGNGVIVCESLHLLFADCGTEQNG